MADSLGVSPDKCPTPGMHATFRYCPNCSWTEDMDKPPAADTMLVPEEMTLCYIHDGCCERDGDEVEVTVDVVDGVYIQPHPHCASGSTIGPELRFLERKGK